MHQLGEDGRFLTESRGVGRRVGKGGGSRGVGGGGGSTRGGRIYQGGWIPRCGGGGSRSSGGGGPRCRGGPEIGVGPPMPNKY